MILLKDWRFYLRLDPSKSLLDKKNIYEQLGWILSSMGLVLILDGFIFFFISRRDFLEENKEELKKLLRLKMGQLRQIVREKNLNVNDNDKFELAIKIIEQRQRK